MDKLILTNEQVRAAAKSLIHCFKENVILAKRYPFRIYGVPRGGVPVAYLVVDGSFEGKAVDSPAEANLIVDDIVDSGATRDRYAKLYPHIPFMALCDHIPNPEKKWVVFPWEVTENQNDQSADDIVLRLLEYIGENPMREGLRETPKRVLKAWQEWTSGYKRDPKQVLTFFKDGSEDYDQMVVVKDLPYFSHCEHHLAPFFGTATIAYIPDKKIVGLSKLGRVLDIFSRRLQVQERMTAQIADCLWDSLNPVGVGVMVKARHLCMESRGLSTQGHFTITSALRGALLSKPEARAEFLSLA